MVGSYHALPSTLSVGPKVLWEQRLTYLRDLSSFFPQTETLNCKCPTWSAGWQLQFVFPSAQAKPQSLFKNLSVPFHFKLILNFNPNDVRECLINQRLCTKCLCCCITRSCSDCCMRVIVCEKLLYIKVGGEGKLEATGDFCCNLLFLSRASVRMSFLQHFLPYYQT